MVGQMAGTNICINTIDSKMVISCIISIIRYIAISINSCIIVQEFILVRLLLGN